MSSPKVSIILVNWNNFKDSVECLESLKQVTYPNCEVIMVDNCSDGDDAKLLKERFGESIILIENEKNYGFAQGCNIGMKDALDRGADYIVLLNNDTVVTPDFLEEPVRIAQSDERVGIAGGKIYCYEYPEHIWFAGGRINYWTGVTPIIGSCQIDSGQFEDVAEVDWICGCFMLITRDLLQTVGMFDKRFFFGWEDVDLCVRATKKNFKVLYVPGSIIWHKGLAPDKKDRLMGPPVYHAAKGRFIFIEKHFTRLQIVSSALYFIVTFPKSALIYTRLFGKRKIPIYILWGAFGYLWKKTTNMLKIRNTKSKKE
jgi:GT2 family glycosyltransferase